MTIAITGASGFIGRRLMKKLAGGNHACQDPFGIVGIVFFGVVFLKPRRLSLGSAAVAARGYG